MEHLPRLIASLCNCSARESPTSSRIALGVGASSAPIMTGRRRRSRSMVGAPLAGALQPVKGSIAMFLPSRVTVRVPATSANLAVPVPAVKVRASIGIPPGRGLGSSATAVIGGLLAAEAIAGHTHSEKQRVGLVDAAVALEHGSHSDNVAAALLGGLVVTSWDERNSAWYAVRAPLPANLCAVLFVPVFSMDTIAGRELLPGQYTKADAVHNLGHLALLLAALAVGDLKGVGAAMNDRFHEPYRARIFPQLPDLLAAARSAGAH